MSYQNSNPNIYAGAPVTTTQTVKGPMSYWWPLGIAITWVIFFIVGGGLLGAWASTASCYSYSSYSYSYNYDDVCTSNSGLFYGGVAMIAIGAILKFVFWILLIIWCVQRRRSRSSTVIYVNAQANAESGHAVKPQANSTVYPAPQANYTGVPQQDYSGVQPAPMYGAPQAVAPEAEKQTVTRYCGQCGTPTSTGYCSRCGTHVPM